MLIVEAPIEGHVWSGLKRLYGYLDKPRKRHFYLVLALASLGALGELMTLGALLPFLTLMADPSKAAAYSELQSIVSVFGWASPENLLWPLTVLFVLVAFGAGAIRVLLSWQTQKFAFRIGHDLGVDMYTRKLHQPYIYHVSKSTSDSIAAVNKIDAIVYGTLLEVMNLITGTIIAVFIVTALVMIDPTIAISAAVGFAGIYFTVMYLVKNRLQIKSDTWARTQNRRAQILQEGLGGIRDVLLRRSQDVFIDQYRDADSDLRRAQAVTVFIGSAPRFVIEACGIALFAIIAYLLTKESEGLGQALPILGVLALGAQRLLPLMQQIYRAWTIIAATQFSLLDVFEILDLPIEKCTNVEPIAFESMISIQKMDFQYTPSSPSILCDISLSIPKGARVGVVGKTGSGKSTLIDVIMGLFKPTSGVIRIDGVALTTAESVRGWQAQIAHVPQSIFLTDATISENIAFGVPKNEIDIDRVRDAAQRSRVSEFVADLPDGFQTIVGERGVRLSGGQRQRIGIARALYRQAAVLVFDEATSALDHETEAEVMEAIKALDRNLTILIVAHRLSTLELCDTIVRLEAGRLVEQAPAEPKMMLI